MGGGFGISPVSTQISRAYSKSGVTLAEAQEKVATAYGLDDVFEDLTNFDPIALAYSATSNEKRKLLDSTSKKYHGFFSWRSF